MLRKEIDLEAIYDGENSFEEVLLKIIYIKLNK